MDQKLVEKNLPALENSALDDWVEANTLGYKFSDLLIKIAFAVGGLSATNIVGNRNQDLLYSKWGIVFLGISVIAGGIQVMLDRSFFRRVAPAATDCRDAAVYFTTYPSDATAQKDIERTWAEYGKIKRFSNETPITLQIVFVILGVIFSLIDVFLA